MDSRELVMRAVEFEGPERLPMFYSAYPGAIDKFGQSVLSEIYDNYALDLNFLGCSDIHASSMYRKGKFQDEWGTVWVNASGGWAGMPKKHPLETWESLEDYDLPDPLSSAFWNLPIDRSIIWHSEDEGTREESCGSDKEKMPRYESEYTVAAGTYPNTNLCVFERLWFLRGLQNALMDLIRGGKKVKTVLDRVLEFNLQIIDRWIELDVSDCVYFSDDVGNQKGMMFSPRIWRQYIKPAYQQMFDKVHKAGMHVFYHSDGEIHEIIPDLISMGVDIFYPQLQVAPLPMWEKWCGGKMCIMGVDTQFVLPHGSVNDVRGYVTSEIEALASYDGGLIADVEISQEIPLANVRTAFETFWEYGKYPCRFIRQRH